MPDQQRFSPSVSQVPLGEGAFAVVHRCVLDRSVRGVSDSGGHAHGHEHAGAAEGQVATAPGREVVAVKQLKTNVLENEAELNAFIAEVDGEASLINVCFSGQLRWL